MALHHMCSPEQLNKESIEDYLFYCKNLHKTPSESFFKHTIYGLRAAYKVMGLEDKRIMLPQIIRYKKVPIVLSKSEVRISFKAPKYLKHRLIIAMLYSCGLRSYELCDLKLEDVDFDHETVFVRRKKGTYDRYVPLNNHLARGLKKYIYSENPYLWLFDSQVTNSGNPRAMTTNGLCWIIKENRSEIPSKKKIKAHTLRHTYATHLLEDGLNLVSLKELLGMPILRPH